MGDEGGATQELGQTIRHDLGTTKRWSNVDPSTQTFGNIPKVCTLHTPPWNYNLPFPHP